jgi:uncharacterized protein YjdB
MKCCVLLAGLLLLITMNMRLDFAGEGFEMTMYVGEVMDLDSFLIENQVLSSEEEMSWTSSNERIVDVNSGGRVEAKEEGKTTVYARDKKNSSRIATIKIRVISMVESFSLKDEALTIKIGEVYNLEYELTPVDGQDKVYEEGINWTSSHPKVVEVDDEGQLLGIKEGTAKIHAKTVDGKIKDTVFITVSGTREAVLIDDGLKEVQVFVGGKHAFKASSAGKEVTLGVDWSSGLKDVLSIDSNGVAEGKKAGRTQVKAATKDQKNFDTIMLHVVSMVKGLELSNKSVELDRIGDSIDLEYTLVPAIPTMMPFEDGVKWRSSNSAIAKVDDRGVVTAKNKGVALITATSVDGEIEAHCSVTVNESSDKAKIPVGKVYLEAPLQELLVGQRYKLPIKIEPAKATETDLKFSMKLGSSSQIKKEEGDYYFTPTVAGKNTIKIISASEEEYLYKVEVVSPIKGVAIDTEALVKEGDEYYFYVGQKIQLKPLFELKKDYSVPDIYEKEVTWVIDDKEYLKIDKEKRETVNDSDKTVYDYYLVGKEKGKTRLKVKSKDGDYEETINIRVLSSYDKLELVDKVTLPINTELVPDVKITMAKDLKYELVSGVNYELEKVFEIKGQYVPIALINEEIALEKDIIIDLQKNAIDSDNSSVIYSEMNIHKSRLSKLEIVRETEKDGFCKIRDNLNLKDVFGENYVVATIDDGVITGKRDGKIELSVSFPGTKKSDTGIYSFSSDLKGIIIVNEQGDVVSVNESGFSKQFTDATLKKQMEEAVDIEKRFGHRTNEDTPSSQYIKEILALEELGFIPEALKDDYRQGVTRIELVETFIPLIEYISGEKMKSPKSSRFKDTKSNRAELAYEIGLVDVLLPTEFKPYEEITPVTLAKTIERMILVLDAYDYNKDRLLIENDLGKGQKLFVDMDKISPSHRKYIEKWAIEYGVIEGHDNKLSPGKVLTREEFLYYVYKLVE